MTTREKIAFYAKVLAENLPDEAVVPLNNVLVLELHRFKLAEFIVEDTPY